MNRTSSPPRFRHPSTPTRWLAGLLALGALATAATGQELPKSGVFGLDLVYATKNGKSAIFGLTSATPLGTFLVGDPVVAVPSRWAHRRRLLGALETPITFVGDGLLLTPMGNAVGNGSIHLVDGRLGAPLVSTLVPTGNPAGYDLAVAEDLRFVFAAADDGAGGTELRGFSWAVPGLLIPLSPASLTLPGAPAAAVNRMGYDPDARTLQVPTAAGIGVVQLHASGTQLSLANFVPTGPSAPTTNVTSFSLAGQRLWVCGSSTFNGSGETVAAGWIAWDTYGSPASVRSAYFGPVPLGGGKQWVPAAGSEEVAVVSNGTDAWVYSLLREPGPGTFFVKAAAVGAVHFPAGGVPATAYLPCPPTCGEPFSVPAVSGTRVAFESSFGPPFVLDPPDGGEKVSIVYSPLDPLAQGSPFGKLGVPGPLGGRISTKGMDRPIWSHDGTRVFAATSHFPGAPNPGVPGLEVLDVHANSVLDEFTSPHTVVQNPDFPNQAVVLPTIWDPRDPGLGALLAGTDFYAAGFHDGLASFAALPWGEAGQKQPGSLPLAANLPDFPALFPPSFDDATASTVPIPGDFGAHRGSFNLEPSLGLAGLTLVAAAGNELLVQATGANLLAAVGIGVPLPVFHVALPTGWATTSEILSL